MRRVVGIVAVLSLVVVNPGWAAADSTGQRNGNTGGLPTTRNDVAPQPSLVLRAPRTQVPIGAVLPFEARIRANGYRKIVLQQRRGGNWHSIDTVRSGPREGAAGSLSGLTLDWQSTRQGKWRFRAVARPAGNRPRLTSGVTTVRVSDRRPLQLEVAPWVGLPQDVMLTARVHTTGPQRLRFQVRSMSETRWTTIATTMPWATPIGGAITVPATGARIDMFCSRVLRIPADDEDALTIVGKSKSFITVPDYNTSKLPYPSEIIANRICNSR